LTPIGKGCGWGEGKEFWRDKVIKSNEDPTFRLKKDYNRLSIVKKDRRYMTNEGRATVKGPWSTKKKKMRFVAAYER